MATSASVCELTVRQVAVHMYLPFSFSRILLKVPDASHWLGPQTAPGIHLFLTSKFMVLTHNNINIQR